MIPMEKVQSGLARYLDSEVIPNTSGLQKVALSTAMTLVVKRLPNLIGNSFVSALGLVNESGVDIDALKEAIEASVGEDGVSFDLLGINFKMNRNDILRIYDCIRSE